MFIFANGGWMGLWLGVLWRHNCMTANIKTYFDKRITFLALVLVLQWNSRLLFLVYVRSKSKVTWNILNLQEWCQNMRNLKYLFKQILPWEKKLKTCQERPHLVSGRFIKVFYKTTTCPRRPLLSGPKSDFPVQVWLYHLIYNLYYLTLSR